MKTYRSGFSLPVLLLLAGERHAEGSAEGAAGVGSGVALEDECTGDSGGGREGNGCDGRGPGLDVAQGDRQRQASGRAEGCDGDLDVLCGPGAVVGDGDDGLVAAVTEREQLRGSRQLDGALDGRRVDDEVAELHESDLGDGVPVIDALDANLLGAEGVVSPDGELRLTLRGDVNGVGAGWDVDDGAEVILQAGGIVEGGGGCEGSAVAGVDLAGGVEASGDGEAGESRLRAEGEADVGVVECGGGSGVPLGGEGSGLGGNGSVDPVVAKLLDAGGVEAGDDEDGRGGVSDGAVGCGDDDGVDSDGRGAEGGDGEC